MTLLQLIKHLRVSLLDDTGGGAIQWQNITENDNENVMLRWSNEELTSFINEAISKAHRGSYLIKDTKPELDVAVVAGTSEYPLDSRIIKVLKASLNSNGRELIESSIDDVFSIQNWSTLEGTPTNYIPDYTTGKITLFKKPLIDDTVHLLVYRTEMTPLSWTSPNESPEIAERYQVSVLNYAAYLAYLKDEANTLDPQRASMFLAMFNNEFDNNSAYTETARVRKVPIVKYGGL